jgi:hypothetical protein
MRFQSIQLNVTQTKGKSSNGTGMDWGQFQELSFYPIGSFTIYKSLMFHRIVYIMGLE